MKKLIAGFLTMTAAVLGLSACDKISDTADNVNGSSAYTSEADVQSEYWKTAVSENDARSKSPSETEAVSGEEAVSGTVTQVESYIINTEPQNDRGEVYGVISRSSSE